MRRAAVAALGEEAHGVAVVLRLGPERRQPVPFAVRLVEPAGPGVDDAVDEELRRPGPPAGAALVAVRREQRPVLLGHLGRDPERADQPRHEVAARVHRDDLRIEPLEAPLPLGNQPRRKRALPIPRHRNLDPPKGPHQRP